MSEDIRPSSGCLMCGSGAQNQPGTNEMEWRIQNLQRLAAEIEAGRFTVQQLRTRRAELCEACCRLLEGISEDSERVELVRRIAQDVKVLQQLKEENPPPNPPEEKRQSASRKRTAA